MVAHPENRCKELSQKIKLIAIVLSAAAVFYQVVIGSGEKIIDHNDHVKKYIEKLNNEPDNCMYLDQVASSYNALENYDKAIEYYKKTLSLCPDNFHALFQIGTCLYRIGNRESGFEYMDKAISKALEVGDQEFHKQYIAEKKAWMEFNNNEK